MAPVITLRGMKQAIIVAFLALLMAAAAVVIGTSALDTFNGFPRP